jgi:hypothetical protein
MQLYGCIMLHISSNAQFVLHISSNAQFVL